MSLYDSVKNVYPKNKNNLQLRRRVLMFIVIYVEA